MDMAVATLRLALVGTPNCGKTALFNNLTGSQQKVANYAGVTVERKKGFFVTPAGREVSLLDLPGTYSLRARSPDEKVTRDLVLGEFKSEAPVDAFICVADATNLRLALRLVLELAEVGKPVILALNMFDIAEKRGIKVDCAALAARLGVTVTTSVAVKRAGIDKLLAEVDALGSFSNDAAANRWQEPNAAALRQRTQLADEILRSCVTQPDDITQWTQRIDRVLLHPVAGLVILFTLLFFMFQAVFTWATPLMDGITNLFTLLGSLVTQYMPPGLLRSLITDGLIAGVGSVLVFLPQIMILFLFIILLEDLGYMARAAFLMDRLMGHAGLHGRAFIPLLSSFACAIPGIMGTRVINNWRDRLTTILVAPLITCSARIPVYTLIIAAFVPRDKLAGGLVDQQGLVMFGLYAVGIGGALLVAAVIRLFWRGQSEPFIMELPDYKLPSLKNVLRGVITRAQIFLSRAGTIIFAMMIIIWFLSSFPGAPAGATEPAINYSLAGIIGHWVEPLLAPIGFDWQIAIALIVGMAAREVAVAALGTIYAVGGGEEHIATALGVIIAAQWSLATGLSMLAWYIFAPQCASTLAVVKRETNSWRWPLIMFAYMLTLAYLASLLTYHLAVHFGGG